MKKLVGLMAVLLVASTVAMAGVVQWYVPYGIYPHDATDLETTDDGTGVLSSFDVLWQLIYAGPDNTADPVDITATGFVSGDDEVWGSRLLSSNDSGIFDEWLYTRSQAQTASDPLPYVYSEDEPCYLYQRVFESQTPTEGTYYYQSDLVLLDTHYKNGTQVFALAESDEVGVKADQQIPGAQPSVPEPATMSLLGLGALAMVLRRKLRK